MERQGPCTHCQFSILPEKKIPKHQALRAASLKESLKKKSVLLQGTLLLLSGQNPCLVRFKQHNEANLANIELAGCALAGTRVSGAEHGSSLFECSLRIIYLPHTMNFSSLPVG